MGVDVPTPEVDTHHVKVGRYVDAGEIFVHLDGRKEVRFRWWKLRQPMTAPAEIRACSRVLDITRCPALWLLHVSDND